LPQGFEGDTTSAVEALPHELLKKYIIYAKEKVHPKHTLFIGEGIFFFSVYSCNELWRFFHNSCGFAVWL